MKLHVTLSQDDPPLPEDDENKEKRTDDISSWDADFLKVDKDDDDNDFLKVWTSLASSPPCTNTFFLSQVDQGTLFELILAANYLDIKVSDIQEQQYYHR